MVATNEIADVAKARSTPAMGKEEFPIWWKDFVEYVHREPYPHEEPSTEQPTVTRELLKAGS